MKNIAGNNVSIFLFRFEIRGKGIDFILNEAIAEDMWVKANKGTKSVIGINANSSMSNGLSKRTYSQF